MQGSFSALYQIVMLFYRVETTEWPSEIIEGLTASCSDEAHVSRVFHATKIEADESGSVGHEKSQLETNRKHDEHVKHPRHHLSAPVSFLKLFTRNPTMS